MIHAAYKVVVVFIHWQLQQVKLHHIQKADSDCNGFFRTPLTNLMIGNLATSTFSILSQLQR